LLFSSLYFLHSLNLKLARFLHLYEIPWNNSTSQTGNVSCHFEKVFRLLFPHGIRQIGRLFSYLKKFFFILQINGAGFLPHLLNFWKSYASRNMRKGSRFMESNCL
jgi:hypothetical protein